MCCRMQDTKIPKTDSSIYTLKEYSSWKNKWTFLKCGQAIAITCKEKIIMKYSGTPLNVPQFKAFGVQFQSSQINNLNYTQLRFSSVEWANLLPKETINESFTVLVNCKMRSDNFHGFQNNLPLINYYTLHIWPFWDTFKSQLH